MIKLIKRFWKWRTTCQHSTYSKIEIDLLTGKVKNTCSHCGEIIYTENDK